MARFVLVHGAWLGAWCWRGTIARLEAQGHEAAAFDLAGHGEDRTPVESVTFAQYVDRTVQAVNDARGEAILVGHSMGGAIARQAAARARGSVRAVVAVTSIWPRDGGTLLSTVDGFDPAYLAEIVWAENRRSARLSEEGVRRFVCCHCAEADIEAALPRRTAEPAAPYETPLFFAGTGVPQYYVECLRDRVVPIPVQRRMHAGWPEDRIYALDADHAPFFSKPEEFASILNQIAGRG